MSSTCRQLVSGGGLTILWLVVGISFGIAVGLRSAADVPAQRREPAAKWFGLGFCFVASVAVLAYIAAHPERRCAHSPATLTLLVIEPFVITGMLVVVGASVFRRRRRSGRDGDEHVPS